MQTFNIIAHTDDASQIEALKAFMKALGIKFELSKGSPYNQEFVEKIKESKQQIKDGKYTTISLDEIWKEV